MDTAFYSYRREELYIKNREMGQLSIFEAGMVICFGVAWPANIYKSIKSRSTKGKSVMFLIIVILGYIFGITHKILYSRDIVMILYIINLLMVLVDLALYYWNKKYEDSISTINVCEKPEATDI